MKIKVNAIAFKKSMKGKSKEVLKKAQHEIHLEASIQMSAIQVPTDTGRLKGSYMATKQGFDIVRFGSQDEQGFKPVEYANWIETGRRRGKGGKVVRRTTRYGIGAFERRKKKILKALPNILKGIL